MSTAYEADSESWQVLVLATGAEIGKDNREKESDAKSIFPRQSVG